MTMSSWTGGIGRTSKPAVGKATHPYLPGKGGGLMESAKAGGQNLS